MRTKLSIILAFYFNLCWSQIVNIVDENGKRINDALVMDKEGNVADKSFSSNVYKLNNLTLPIKVYAYGYNNFQIDNKEKTPQTIVLKALSDSLQSIEIISQKISASASLSRILNNTVLKYTPPEVIDQNFNYLLLNAHGDTLAHATGVISKSIGSQWHKKIEPYYKSVSRLYLDSSQNLLLKAMWPSPFVFSQKGGFVTNLINRLEDSPNNTFQITLDSIRSTDSIKHYYFKGTNVYKRFLGQPHTSDFHFTAIGTELSNSILDKATIERHFDNMGMKSYNSFNYVFSPRLSYFEDEFYTIFFKSDDEKCPSCKESLTLTEGREVSNQNKNQFKAGYYNLWQFKDVAQRDSILPILMSN